MTSSSGSDSAGSSAIVASGGGTVGAVQVALVGVKIQRLAPLVESVPLASAETPAGK